MRERLIVALDVPDARMARQTVQRLGESAGIYKIGLQLFTAEGPDVVREMVSSGRRVFLDLKLHDIPNTVARAVKSVAELGPSMITVHASGGPAVLRAAVEAAGPRVAVWAVTVLTSFSDDDLRQTGVSDDCAGQVVRLASLAQAAGCKGVVCSPRETAQLRRSMGGDFAIVNPGVRPAGTDKNDQERTATPAEAISSGASHIVVGRPITQSPDPAAAAEAVIAEMVSAFFRA
ncbi:MAG TPA: orotidine-5'-phosphate decarboxylase [Verrucomicrobiae bacterium]|nr:orotidine-5'-phosphate decarboxylase [Verrucomicrobiae bacterium]